MPAYQSPARFPGASKLPPLAQALLERLFPPDQLPMPGAAGAVIGPRVPVPKAAGKSLLEAFRPWGRQLEKAYPEMFGKSQVPQAPESMGLMQGAAQRLRDLLKQPPS